MDYTAEYCRAVLTFDERLQLDEYLEALRRYSLFGITFDTTADMLSRKQFASILKEELERDTLRPDLALEPWRQAGLILPRHAAIRRCWDLLGLETGESRLRLFLEYGRENCGIGLLESLLHSFLFGRPSESDIYSARFNPWLRSLVCQWIAQQEREIAKQAAE
jgi:hypothetical protein